ncbi:MAG: formate dehydrogenase subunit gamma [Gaiellales bacterium]|nr:formate dehydrogenase subunit gamma [Gaiellales bacterium]
MAVTIRRFARSERAAHWLLAAAFFTMLLSGGMVPHHYVWTNTALDVHVGAAIVLVVGLLALTLPGRALKRTARELAILDADDRAWLSPARLLNRKPAPPVGRFNAGQKMNARLSALGLGGLYVTGISLLVTRHFPISGLHGPFAFLTGALVAGHIFMALLNPSTRHAMRGMTLGSVNRDWAIHHFPRWVEESDREPRSPD